MGTKNAPGNFDCYANAADDEPMFVLLARDPLAPDLVVLWAERRAKSNKSDVEKINEARRCADAMLRWRGALSVQVDKIAIEMGVGCGAVEFAMKACRFDEYAARRMIEVAIKTHIAVPDLVALLRSIQ